MSSWALNRLSPLPLAVAAVLATFGAFVVLFGWWSYGSVVCTLACTTTNPACCVQEVAAERAAALRTMLYGAVIALLGGALAAGFLLRYHRGSRPGPNPTA